MASQKTLSCQKHKLSSTLHTFWEMASTALSSMVMFLVNFEIICPDSFGETAIFNKYFNNTSNNNN